ncbi:MAG: hypothetical protein WA752_13505, partial [Mycobacterium sp.]|uniref:hypothetical protein n=1 Tax=Mycobacterium sp. TaxID=1785 RepID=UPI003C81F584
MNAGAWDKPLGNRNPSRDVIVYHWGNLRAATESGARAHPDCHVRASQVTTRRGMTGPLSFSITTEQEALVNVARG